MTLVQINNCEGFLVQLNHEKITKDPENMKIKLLQIKITGKK